MEIDEVTGLVHPGLRFSGMPGDDWDLAGWGTSLVVSLSDHLPPQAARRFEWGTRGGALGEGSVVFVHWPIEDGDLPDWDRASLVAGTVVNAVKLGLEVLVHCHEGRNRSALVTALALRELTGCSGEDAVAVLRAARPGVLSNSVFADALGALPALA
jgi:protein-tyrosine phosphatase